MLRIEQQNGLALEIDNSEQDAVIIWGELESDDPQVVIIYRHNIDKFISALERCKQDFLNHSKNKNGQRKN